VCSQPPLPDAAVMLCGHAPGAAEPLAVRTSFGRAARVCIVRRPWPSRAARPMVCMQALLSLVLDGRAAEPQVLRHGAQRAAGGADCARWLRACSAATRRWRRSCGASCARVWSWALTTPSARSMTRAPAATATWRAPARARRATCADSRVTGLSRGGLPAPFVLRS